MASTNEKLLRCNVVLLPVLLSQRKYAAGFCIEPPHLDECALAFQSAISSWRQSSCVSCALFRCVFKEHSNDFSRACGFRHKRRKSIKDENSDKLHQMNIFLIFLHRLLHQNALLRKKRNFLCCHLKTRKTRFYPDARKRNE